MTFVLGKKSRAKLEGVHPDLIKVVELGLKYSVFDFAVSEGLRSYERQVELFKKGFSWTLKSKHLRQADGFSHAVDLVGVGDLDQDGDIDAQDSKHTWDRKVYDNIALAMKQAANELHIKIRWGGDFKSKNGRPLYDGPHFELL